MVQLAPAEMIGVLQLLEQELIFFLAEIDLLAIFNQIGGLLLLIRCVDG